MDTTYDSMPRKVRFEWIAESWQLFGARWGLWVGAGLLYFLITFAIQGTVGYELGMFDGIKAAITMAKMQSAGHPVAPPVVKPPDLETNLIYYGVSYVLGAFFAGGWMRMAIRQVRGERLSLGDLFSGFGFFLPMLIFEILMSAVPLALMLEGTALTAKAGVGIVVLLWVVVGIGSLFWLGLCWPAIALIADGEGLGKALARSAAAMKQDWLMAALYTLAFGAILVLSAIPCYLGLFITSPMMYLSGALCYRDMIGMPGVPRGGDGGVVYYAGDAPAGIWPPAPQSTAPPASEVPTVPPPPAQ